MAIAVVALTDPRLPDGLIARAVFEPDHDFSWDDRGDCNGLLSRTRCSGDTYIGKGYYWTPPTADALGFKPDEDRYPEVVALLKQDAVDWVNDDLRVAFVRVEILADVKGMSDSHVIASQSLGGIEYRTDDDWDTFAKSAVEEHGLLDEALHDVVALAGVLQPLLAVGSGG